MGVPGLARRLEPYASHHLPQDLSDYTAIIDGPALAYFAYKLALIVSVTQSKLPSYANVVTQSLQWLNDLKTSGVDVSQIFFDGALPIEKRGERLHRMEQTRKGVQQFRKSYSSAACPVPTLLGTKCYAFLAPALREAFLSTDLASKTRLVPGEADGWCALHAQKQPKSIIFTSDTDLLLYDYGKETLVAFLHETDIKSTLTTYSPHDIRRKLKVESLRLFAFAARENPSDATSDVVRKMRKINTNNVDYIIFSEQYALHASSLPTLSIRCEHQDVRVSEYIFQALNNEPALFVYLPLLLEDPNQGSAWNDGENIRVLAYSLFAAPGSMIQEHICNAQSIVAHKLQLYPHTELQISIDQIERDINEMRLWASSREIKPEVMWFLYALHLLIAQINTTYPIGLAIRLLNGEFDNTWKFIQLLARLQALLYSLRMLKQIIEVKLQLKHTRPDLLASLTTLNKHFSDFPPITSTFIIPGQTPRILLSHGEVRPLIGEIYGMAGKTVPEERISRKKKKGQTREANRKRKKTSQLQAALANSNAFSVLAENDQET